MIHDPISALRSRAEMLQVAELLHRIGNDYTRAILFASLRAANASSNGRCVPLFERKSSASNNFGIMRRYQEP